MWHNSAEPSGFVLWAPYWAVCGILLYLSPVLDAILSSLVPLYPELKLVFVAWLTLPRYQVLAELICLYMFVGNNSLITLVSLVCGLYHIRRH